VSSGHDLFNFIGAKRFAVKLRRRLKTRNWKTRHQLAGVENEGINCMDSQWDNFCNVLK